MTRFAIFSLVLGWTLACSGDKKSAQDTEGGSTTNPPTSPVPGAADQEYTLDESTAEVTLFTAPVTRKPTTSDAAPAARGSGLHLHAARNEFEPALLELAAGHSVVAAKMGTFPNLGAGQRVSLDQVGFLRESSPTSREGARDLVVGNHALPLAASRHLSSDDLTS